MLYPLRSRLSFNTGAALAKACPSKFRWLHMIVPFCVFRVLCGDTTTGVSPRCFRFCSNLDWWSSLVFTTLFPSLSERKVITLSAVTFNKIFSNSKSDIGVAGLKVRNLSHCSLCGPCNWLMVFLLIWFGFAPWATELPTCPKA